MENFRSVQFLLTNLYSSTLFLLVWFYCFFFKQLAMLMHLTLENRTAQFDYILYKIRQITVKNPKTTISLTQDKDKIEIKKICLYAIIQLLSFFLQE